MREKNRWKHWEFLTSRYIKKTELKNTVSEIKDTLEELLTDYVTQKNAHMIKEIE